MCVNGFKILDFFIRKNEILKIINSKFNYLLKGVKCQKSVIVVLLTTKIQSEIRVIKIDFRKKY